MLDQYILDRLHENEKQMDLLSDQLYQLQKEEENLNRMIHQLVDQEDVGIEFFSPRSIHDSTRQRVSEIKKQIESIHIQQAKITESLAEHKIENTKYQEMLDEIKSRNEELQIHEESKQKHSELDVENKMNKDEFKNILQRVDKCLSLLNTSNKTSCKNELTNLKYYLKALISSG